MGIYVLIMESGCLSRLLLDIAEQQSASYIYKDTNVLFLIIDCRDCN